MMLRYHAENIPYAMEMLGNDAKSGDVLEWFLIFVDNTSVSNGRKQGSYGKIYYSDRKFTQIRIPDKEGFSISVQV